MPGPSTVVDEDDGLGALPAGWEKRIQPEGEKYSVKNFIHSFHSTIC